MPTWIHTAPAALAAALAAGASADVTFTFSGATWAGFSFTQIFGPTAGAGGQPQFLVGTLTGVSVNATLNASSGDTSANDLSVYVRLPPMGPFGLLQVGGFSSLNAQQRYSWANGSSDEIGTTVVDTRLLATPLTFGGTSNDPAVWLGNGWGGTGASGTWTGSITLIGVSVVPAPGAIALVGASLVVIPRRRRRA